MNFLRNRTSFLLFAIAIASPFASADLVTFEIVPGIFPDASSVSASIDGGILGSDTDESSISGTVVIDMENVVEPFGNVRIVDLSLALDDGFSFRLALGALRASAEPGSVKATMIEPGNPTPLVNGMFDQLDNLFGLEGAINVSLDPNPIDLSVIEPQPLDLTGVRITTVEDQITAELSIALMLQYDVDDVPVFGTIPVTIELIGNSLAISDPLVIDFPGDFDGDGALGVGDINVLTEAVLRADAAFDLTNDGITNDADRVFWVEVLKNTYFGDSNLDGEFSSADFVLVFQASEYEDDVADNSTWATGDWNGDREFDSADFVLAFQSNGFEIGPRTVAVPEPTARVILSMVVMLAVGRIKNMRFSGRQYQQC